VFRFSCFVFRLSKNDTRHTTNEKRNTKNETHLILPPKYKRYMQQTHQIRFAIFIAILATAVLPSCVEMRVYQAEYRKRLQCETRDSARWAELNYRKVENSGLIKQVGELNRTIGTQQSDLKRLQEDLFSAKRTATSSQQQLNAEKETLRQELEAKNQQLDQQNNRVLAWQTAQQQRLQTLRDLYRACAAAYPDTTGGIDISIVDETVQLTFRDAQLFDANGVTISAAGRETLRPFATFLSERPDLDLDIVAYTDNMLPPKEKTLKDTWDWSLTRATNIARTLIRELNINANQLTPTGKGEFYPVSGNDTPEGRAQNRRTIIVLRPALPSWPR
jgi:chemotaxis protein MotB